MCRLTSRSLTEDVRCRVSSVHGKPSSVGGGRRTRCPVLQCEGAQEVLALPVVRLAHGRGSAEVVIGAWLEVPARCAVLRSADLRRRCQGRRFAAERAAARAWPAAIRPVRSAADSESDRRAAASHRIREGAGPARRVPPAARRAHTDSQQTTTAVGNSRQW